MTAKDPTYTILYIHLVLKTTYIHTPKGGQEQISSLLLFLLRLVLNNI